MNTFGQVGGKPAQDDSNSNVKARDLLGVTIEVKSMEYREGDYGGYFLLGVTYQQNGQQHETSILTPKSVTKQLQNMSADICPFIALLLEDTTKRQYQGYFPLVMCDPTDPEVVARLEADESPF